MLLDSSSESVFKLIKSIEQGSSLRLSLRLSFNWDLDFV